MLQLAAVVAAAAVDQEEDPEQVKRYLSSRLTIRIVVTATTNSATKQEMVSVRKKQVTCKVRSGPLSFPNDGIPYVSSLRGSSLPFLAVMNIPIHHRARPRIIFRLQWNSTDECNSTTTSQI